MSKTAFTMTIIMLAAILSLFVVPNAFAKSSDGDGDSGGGRTFLILFWQPLVNVFLDFSFGLISQMGYVYYISY